MLAKINVLAEYFLKDLCITLDVFELALAPQTNSIPPVHLCLTDKLVTNIC